LRISWVAIIVIKECALFQLSKVAFLSGHCIEFNSSYYGFNYGQGLFAW